MDDKKYCVYMHKNKINEKIYIGITCQKPELRWGHGSRYKKSTYFRRAVQKYGWDNFEHIVLFDSLTEPEAKQKEIDLIAKYNSNQKEYGYNLAAGGQGTNGYRHTDEAKELMRTKRLGSKGYWDGKHLSEEHRQKLSAAHKGQCPPMKGKSFSEESKQKMRDAKLGKQLSEQHKRKLSESSTLKRKVKQIDLLTGEVIKVFDSIIQASTETGTSGTGITKCCKGSIKYSNGFKWQYA